MKKMYRKRILSLLLCLAMLVGLFSGLTISVAAEDTVWYLSPIYVTDGDAGSGLEKMETKSLSSSEYTVIPQNTGYLGDLGVSSWYVVSGSCELSSSTYIYGNVNLILLDGCSLTVIGEADCAGIRVTEGASLTIYSGDSGETISGTGKLTATGGSDAAGIGGSNAEIGKNITINGGVITATGGENGAGIGGGGELSGSDIIINGGVVTATGGENGAGIGGGAEGSGSNIIINGGVVTATGTTYAAGIGGGSGGDGYDITINEGTITASGSSGANAIGSCESNSSNNIRISKTLTVKAGSTANPSETITSILDDWSGMLQGNRYVTIQSPTQQLAAVKIGDTSYSTLSDAVAAVPTDGTETTIVMQTDTALSGAVTITEGRNIVLDLNGKQLTVTTADCCFTVGENCTLSITDSTGGGGITGSSGSALFSAAGQVSISGGTFSEDISSYLAPGYEAVADETAGTWTVQTKTHFTVAVQSRIQGTDYTAANVSGGGAGISSIDGTVLSAPNVSGYTFAGWYTGYSSEENGTKLSDSSTYTYCPGEDVTVTAVYEPQSDSVFRLTVYASEFTLTGNDAVQTGYSSSSLKAGTAVTVTYTDTDKVFLYWANENDKVVSKSEAYTFVVGSNTAIHTVYASGADGTKAYVVFLSAYEQILSAHTYLTTDAITYPTIPSRMGYTFERWAIDDSNQTDACEANIRAAMGTDSVIRVVPVYQASGETYSISVTYQHGAATEAQPALTGIQAGDKRTVTAPETYDDAEFSYWSDGTTILSYNRSYLVVSTRDVNLTAVYGIDSTASGTSAITSVTKSMNGSYYKLTFTETYSIPDGCTLVKTGFIRTLVSSAANETNMVLDADNTKTYAASLTDSYGVYTVNLNTVNPDTVVWMRGYVQYTDAAGTLITVYSAIVEDSYNTIS